MDNIINLQNDQPFLVRASGVIIHDKLHSTPVPRQNDFMLLAFTAGYGIYSCLNSKLRVGAGMIGLVAPEPPYGFLMSDKARPYSHAYCRFRGHTACELSRKIIQHHGGYFFKSENAFEIFDIIRSMGHMIRWQMPEEMGRREVELMHILLLLTGDYSREEDPVLSRESISNYLEMHITDMTNLDEMAQYFKVSKATLCRKSQRLTGTSIQRLHQSMKMQWARDILMSGEANVREAARRTGYRDSLYFSRIFKKTFGQKPSDFKPESTN